MKNFLNTLRENSLRSYEYALRYRGFARNERCSKIIKIKDWMTHPVITVTQETKLSRVVKLMGDNNIGSVIVVNNDVPIGIFTERDLVRIVRKDFNISELTVKEVMSSPVKKVGLESTVLDISKLMNKHHFRRVVVVDDEGKIAGIVTAQDLIKLMSC